MAEKMKFETSMLEYGEVNSGFAKVKISIMTHEQVANGTRFSKENIDSRKSGLNYLPVIGEYKEDNKDFGTHGGKLEISDDGFEFVDTTRPYGVVIENSARWESVPTRNGETTEYLVADAYLWIDRYKELECIYEGKLNNQSMEINVLDGCYDTNSNVYDIKDFEFSALCILGSSVSPAFHEAKVMTQFESQDFKSKYEEMMNALTKYMDNHTESEVTEMKDEVKVDEAIETTEEGTTEDNDVVDTEVEKATTEEEPKESETQGETTEEVEEVDETEETTKEVEDSTDYKQEYETLKDKYDSLQGEYQALVEYKKGVEKKEKLSIIESFSNKLDNEDVKDVLDSIDTYSAIEVETKCFAILGKKALEGKYSEKSNEEVRISTSTTQYKASEEPAWVKILRK